MKKLIVAAFIMLLGSQVFAQNYVSLDNAVQGAAKNISAKLQKGTKIAIVNFSSPNDEFSEYVLDEMNQALVSDGKLVVVDRANLSLIQKEMNFQMSGDVSDESMQAIGKKLGAQSIVSGNVRKVGNYYRVRFKTINVKTAAIEATSSANVKNDSQVESLLIANTSKYSSGEQTNAGVLNLIFGLGSFNMGDKTGGTIIAAGQGIGLGFLALYLFGVGGYNEPSDGQGGGGEFKFNTDYLAVAIIVHLAADIYGFIRPGMYTRNQERKSFASNIFENINVAVLPEKDGGIRTNLVYSAKFDI